MRVMAIGAGHLALGNRVMGRLVDFHAPVLVAGKANLGLGAFVANLVLCRVYLVAGGTDHIAALVRAAHPVRASGILLVACKAGAGHVVRCSASLFEG